MTLRFLIKLLSSFILLIVYFFVTPVGIEPIRSDCKSVDLPSASVPSKDVWNYSSTSTVGLSVYLERVDGLEPTLFHIGSVVPYQLGDTRNCDEFWVYSSLNVNEVIKPTNITGISFNSKTITKKTSVFITQN